MANEWKNPVYAEEKEGMLVFRVSSETRASWSYNVELDCNIDADRKEYNGRCDCEDFTTRCFPNFRDNGKKVIPYRPKRRNRTQCKHIERARREFIRLMICAITIEKRTANHG